MDEELKRKFLQQKLEDLLNDNIHLLPTIICEMDDPRITELVRPFIMFPGAMKPFKIQNQLKIVSERLDGTKGKTNWGDLYIDVNIN